MKEKTPFHKQMYAKPKNTQKLRKIWPKNKINVSFRPRYTQRTVRYNKDISKN